MGRDTTRSLRRQLVAIADPGAAVPMAAYMRNRFDYLGVKTPARRAATADLMKASRSWPVDDVISFATELRAEPEREFHYVASDILARNDGRLRADDIDHLGDFITTKSWWDTVDALASPTVGTMVSNHAELGSTMDDWIDADDFWLARVAIIHQLRFHDATDQERLFRYSLRRSGDDEFFIRKAIGWALRQFARTDPDAVRNFVDAHRDVLSPLTVREATKHL